MMRYIKKRLIMRDMRNIFIRKLMEFAQTNDDLYVLTADLGYRALEPFRDAYPTRLINVGVAEQNMVGIAAGLAMMGKKVCVYSIVPFVTLRCFEQIRNDVCFHYFNVTFVGVGGGFSYGNQGVSHNTTEDLAVMRALPNMSVFSPGDAIEANAMSELALRHQGPAYIRLGLAGKDAPYQFPPTFAYGKATLVKAGDDIAIISTGNILDTASEVVCALERLNYRVRMISVHCVKPLDEELILS